MASKINLTPYGLSEIQVQPVGYLGNDFDLYRNACSVAGFRYRQVPVRGNYGPITKIADLKKQLEDSGFEVAVHPDLAAQVQAVVSQMRQGTKIAQALIDKVTDLIGLKLFSFQYAGVEAFVKNKKWLNFDEMGTGKTIMSLVGALVVSIIETGEIDSEKFEDAKLKEVFDNIVPLPTLVVVPAVVKYNWRDEALKWRKDYKKITILKGRKSFRWPEPGELVITNYDILPEMEERKLQNGHKELIPPEGVYPKTIVISDEAHALKSPKAQRTRRFKAIAKAVRANQGYAWLMTGTPILNKATELWTISNVADLHVEGFSNWANFCRLFNGHEGRFGYVWGTPRPEAAEAIKKISLRRHLRDVVPDLPELTYKYIPVDIDNVTMRQCDKAIQQLMGDVQEDNPQYDALLQSTIDTVMATKSSGAGFDLLSEARAALAIAKLPALLELIEDYEEQEKPLVVFSAHRAPIEALEKREGWAAIHGDVSPQKRQEIVKKFQAGELKGVALTIQAGGVGLTLTHGSHVVFLDLNWTPEINNQAVHRVLRIGQTRGVLVIVLVANHKIESNQQRLLEKKQNLVDVTTNESARPEVEDTTEALLEATQVATLISMDRKDHNPKRPRAPLTVQEQWAANGVQVLAACDSDYAAEENGIGFSKTDTSFGHILAFQVATTGKLTDRQWRIAVMMLKKYHRQIGSCPT